MTGSGADLLIEAWALREASSSLSELCLITIGVDAHLELKTLLGLPATIATRLANGGIVTRSGVVRAADKLGGNGGLARYRLSIVPWLWLATQQSRSQIFQDRSVEQIIESVLHTYQNQGEWRFSDEASAFLAQAPRRTYCTQYRETDYAFLCRLLAEEGLGFRFEQDPEAAGGHRLVIFADSQAQPESLASPARFHRSSSQEASDAVQTLRRDIRQAVGQITLSTWNVDHKRLISASAPNRYATRSPNALQIDYDDILGLDDQSRNIDRSDTLERYARLLMESVEVRADTLQARSSLRALSSGQRLQLDTAPALGLSAPPDLFITAIEHVGLNTLPVDTEQSLVHSMGPAQDYLLFTPGVAPPSPTAAADVLGLMSPPVPAACPEGTVDADVLEQARQTGYGNLFSAALTERPWRPALAGAHGARLHHRPLIHGMHSAVVVGPEGQDQASGADEIYCNARGDIRLRFHWQDPTSVTGENRHDNALTRWVRVAQRQTGPGMGWQWLPRIGQEVLVKFANHDPDQPIVMGAAYNGRGAGGVAPTPGGRAAETSQAVFQSAHDTQASAQQNLVAGGSGGHAPAWHGASPGAQGHRNAAALSGFKSKEMGGNGYNQLVFDDTDEQLRLQLHSSTAHSQLNLGHLIHQQDNYRGSFRGQGFELRSDAYVALRAGQGVLLSTYHGPGGQHLEPVGDAAGLLALVKQLDTLTGALHQAASGHQAVGLASHAGASSANASLLHDAKAPAPAWVHTVSGTVDRNMLASALDQAQARQTATGPTVIPHLNDPIIAVAARAGVLAVAGQHLQWVVGETVTLASTTQVNAVFAGQWRAHTGQAISVLAGAAKPDHGNTALHITAAQQNIDLQAQHHEIRLLASGALSLASVAQHIAIAAATRVRIATTQGASITIEGGNITFECPGTITYRAALRNLSGPVSRDYPLPVFPNTPCLPCLISALQSGSPLATVLS